MLTLYNTDHSTCSQKVRLALAEKGVDYTHHQISLRDNEQLEPWYLKLNPNGVVPTLVHDDRIIIDSTVIGEYADDVFDGPALTPEDPYERARMRMWRQYIDEVPTPAVRVPSFNLYLYPKFKAANRDWAERRKKQSPLRKGFVSRLGPDGFPKEDVDDAMAKLRLSLERMSQSLETGPWLAGGRYTLADGNMTPYLVRLEDLRLTQLWDDLPRVADWYERIQQRPSFDAAYFGQSRISLDTVP